MMAIEFYKLIVGSLSILIGFYAKKYEDIDKVKAFPEHPTDYLLPKEAKYDYIVVGVGSAGTVLANRISKDFTVLLIEAGGNPLPQTYVPSNFPYLIQNPDITYQWDSVKQTRSCLSQDGIAKIGGGKFLGGTSVINGLIYNRGNPKDYDNWANLTGDDSWNYTNVLKYFQMSEDFYEDDNDNGHLGIGGTLPIRKGGIEGKLVFDAFIESGKELGYNELKNTNSPQAEGFGPLSDVLGFGRRVSTYDAFIKPILDRNSLTISRYSQVTKVDINDDNQAVGVHYLRHGIPMYARADKEVILSAGALNSPLILLRSGVGPAEQLRANNIKVKADLPVGQNFQDHPVSYLRAKYDNPSKALFSNVSQEDVNSFLSNGTGPLSLAWGMFGQAFITSSVAKSEGTPDWPDIQLIMRQNSQFHVIEGDNTYELFALLGRVVSRGSITLNPKDPGGDPIWDPKWLVDERDLTVIAEGLKIIDRILTSKAFKDIGLTLEKPVVSGCGTLEYGTDDYWKCHVQHLTRTAWHPVSTCKMGKRDDPTSVVDSKLRVHGIGGLRVIDNSIQPTITNANTNAPAIMIGQFGADLILSESKVKIEPRV